MQTWFQRLTDATSIARTSEMLHGALQSLARDLGFEGFAYLHLHPSQTRAVSNYPQDWQNLYFERDYVKVDPVIKTASKTMRVFSWAAGDPRQHTKPVRSFFANAADFGIRSGISIPVRTAYRHMSMLTLASNKPTLRLDKDIDQVAAATAVAFLHAKLEAVAALSTAQPKYQLTMKQALCLKWSAEGKSMKAIATIENMSFATVNFHLNNARKTLDAGSLAQATAIATKLGLI